MKLNKACLYKDISEESKRSRQCPVYQADSLTKRAWKTNLAIARDERDRYHLAEELGYFQGVLRVNPKGFGFIDLDDVSYYVAREHLHLGMDQDVVAARILQDAARSGD